MYLVDAFLETVLEMVLFLAAGVLHTSQCFVDIIGKPVGQTVSLFLSRFGTFSIFENGF